MTKDDIIKLTLDEDEIKNIIVKAKENNSISERDNLRDRHPNVQFDCILRGYVGEYAMKKWFNLNGIELLTNQLSVGENIDVDFLYKEKNIELKTSLIPDDDVVIDNVIDFRDIKLIKREPEIENIKGDVHVQVYFEQKSGYKDYWLEQQKIDLGSNDIDYLYKTIGAKRYKNDTCFVSWIDKPTIIDRIKSMDESQRTWVHGKREFWTCKIRNSKKPIDLIEYLKNIN